MDNDNTTSTKSTNSTSSSHSNCSAADATKKVTFVNDIQAKDVTGPTERQVRRGEQRELEQTGDKKSSKSKSKRQSSSKPHSSIFHQQKLLAYQPVLTPQKAIPFLLLLGLVFIPLGIVFLITSNNVIEYVFDYTDCLDKATESAYTDSKMQFEWKKDAKDGTCFIRFKTTSRKAMGAPVFLYYQLSNFYQNNRLYAKSYSYEQLMGKALPADKLKDCEPLIGPKHEQNNKSVYYPCGLIANSYFSDSIQVDNYDFSPTNIAYEYDKKMFAASKYNLKEFKVFPPISWDPKVMDLDLHPDGSYKTLPALHEDERFMNWMRVSGLPTFRKLYGRYDGVIPEQTTLTIKIHSKFDTRKYDGRKAVVLSTASWMGGKNRFLGLAYIAFGTFLIIVGFVCLARHLLAPRTPGDIRYLSWYQQE